MDFKSKRREFYEGKLSQSQAMEFLKFLESKEAEEVLSSELIQLWSNKIKDEDKFFDDNDIWNKINLKKDGNSAHLLRKDLKNSEVSRFTWLSAATVFLVLGITTVFINLIQEKEDSKNTVAVVETFETNSNLKGEKTKIMLEDGSVVYLNSQSSITYPKNFKSNRTIQLVGEAFFDVAKDPDHPFEVEANGIITTALGTSFNISTFNENQKVAVTLLTGKVKLNQYGNEDFIELNPGEESLLSTEYPEMEKYKVKGADKILWTQGILRFDEATLDEMVEILERWYGVNIEVNGMPHTINASGIFDNQESLRNVLNVMSKTLEFEFVIDDQTITLNFN